MELSSGYTFVVFNRRVLRSNVNQYHAGESRVQRSQLEFSRELAHDFALQLVEATELFAFEAHAVQADEPADQSAFRRLGVIRRALLNKATLVPSSVRLFELHSQISHSVRVRFCDADGAVQVIYGFEMMALFKRDDSQLVLAHARLGANGACQAIVSN